MARSDVNEEFERLRKAVSQRKQRMIAKMMQAERTRRIKLKDIRQRKQQRNLHFQVSAFWPKDTTREQGNG
jgi:hypothetical protein